MVLVDFEVLAGLDEFREARSDVMQVVPRSVLLSLKYGQLDGFGAD
jgi:hypothetical protein